MIVGVHENMSDTAFSKTRLLRVAKTDDRGQFTIRGLAPGKYRVFALEDKDNDYAYSSPEEDLAFYDFVVEPSWRAVTAIDSIYNPLTGQLDSVTERTRTQFLPNDIVLRSFNSEVRQQYLAKSERLDSTRVYIKFNTRSDSLPRLSVIGHHQVAWNTRGERAPRLAGVVADSRTDAHRLAADRGDIHPLGSEPREIDCDRHSRILHQEASDSQKAPKEKTDLL